MKVLTARMMKKASFRLPPEEQALLAQAIAQGERGEVVDGWQLLADLQD